MLITDSSTAPIALLLVSVVRVGEVRVAALERMHFVLVKTDCCSVLKVMFLGFPDKMVYSGVCDQSSWGDAVVVVNHS